ncbi:unnamed protein product [Phytophthora lilii]|uniref:Unnamed protein product n=1 Tax=Phytophthora lilii TaxID=2077276 RepID=A0A9W6X2R9_9STRA|nr:unnamed protein product [Phytophthora lilii]
MTNTQEAVPEDFDGDQLSVTESEREIIYLREQLAALKLQLEKAQASAKAEAARGSSGAHTQNETETASKLCLRSRSKRRLRITPLALDIPEFSGNEASNDRQKSEQHDGIVNRKTQQFKRDGFPVKLSNTMNITMKTPDELVARPTNNTSPQIKYVCCDELNNDESPMQNCNYLPDKDDTKNSRIENEVPHDRSSTDNQAMVDKSTQYEPPHCLLYERKIPVDYVVLSPSQIFREIYYQKQKELARAPFPWPHQRCTDASKSQSRNRKTCLTPIPQSEEASNQQHSKVSKSGDALRYILMCTQQLIENSPELGDQDCKAENDDPERNGDAYSPLSFNLFVSRVTALYDQRRRQQEYIHRLTQRFRHLQNLLGAADVNTQLIELSKYKLDYQQHSLQQHLEECEDIVANRLWMRLQNREMAIDTFADNWSEKMAEVYLSDDQYEACVCWHTHRDDDTFFHDHILPFVLNGWISVTSADLENEQLWLAL